jgi:putative CocE/NonD family hydrolase
MIGSLRLALLCLLVAAPAFAQELAFPASAIGDQAALDRALPDLAGRTIAIYAESDRDKYLDNLFRMQIAAGRYAQARVSLAELRTLRAKTDPTRLVTLVRYEIYSDAKVREATTHTPFADAFGAAFTERMAQLDDGTAYQVLYSLGTAPHWLEDDLRDALHAHANATALSQADATDLLRKDAAAQLYREVGPLVDTLTRQDDARRYDIRQDLPIRTADGATVTATVVRPRLASGKLPALLEFSIYADPDGALTETKLSAAHGYVGVFAYSRGKGHSPDSPVAFEHDGGDADAVIDWIAGQDWSDGRVGMYGGSYDGFSQWAAAKHLPPALKAIMPSVTAAPGIDIPMEGNVFADFFYRWPLYTTSGPWLDEEHYNDNAHWDALYKSWYRSGRAYRALPDIDSKPNPFYLRWLAHPSYDAYWQAMIPYRDDFSRINIPVLTTDGYYDPGQIGGLYYFNEHRRYNPHADHYLLIGPYDHVGAQRQSVNVLDGYTIDPVARIDIMDLRYRWFDHVFKGAPLPEELKDRVNYEVMGANVWKHVASLEQMGTPTRFYLGDLYDGSTYRLATQPSKQNAFVAQTVDFADRSNVDATTSGLIIDKVVDDRNAIVFKSEPMQEPTEISGLFSGRLDVLANKKDFDLSIALYEQMPDGNYFQLSTYISRASYIRDRSERHLLVPGRKQRLAFRSGRLTSRQFQKGSRLVVVVSVPKQPDLQINYGTGKDVSDETIADAKEPLHVRWYGDSFIDVPMAR